MAKGWSKTQSQCKKAFIKKYVKSDNIEEAEKDFVWDSLDEENQEVIKNEVIAPLKKKRVAVKETEGWIDELEEAIHAIKTETFTEKTKKNKAKRQINKLLKNYINKKKEEWKVKAFVSLSF